MSVFAYSRYQQHKAYLENFDRVKFVLYIDELPDSLEIEAAWVDNWTEYHLVFACRDRTGELGYLLEGRDWDTKTKAPWPLKSMFEDELQLEHTITREAKWRGEDTVEAAVLFDADGERFIVEYHVP
ncbi:MAG: hypothetical protein ACSHX9_04240 [Luteolibacter sp.]